MLPIAGSGKFMTIGDRIGLPDDVTMGYIIEHLLKVPLTVIETFHSHLEPMDILPKETFKEQVTFSYGHIKNSTNVLLIDGFDDKIDPTRFLSLHCHLYPNLANGKLCSPQALQMNWNLELICSNWNGQDILFCASYIRWKQYERNARSRWRTNNNNNKQVNGNKV